MARSLPWEIRYQRAAWNGIAVALRLLQIGLGAVGIICPLIVATFATQKWPILTIKALTLAGAASIAIFKGFEIGAVANRFRLAWKGLNAEIVAFDCGLSDLKSVVAAYRHGEDIIGSLKANPFTTDETDGSVDQAKAER